MSNNTKFLDFAGLQQYTERIQALLAAKLDAKDLAAGVRSIVDEAIADAADNETYDSLIKLVEAIEKHTEDTDLHCIWGEF